MPKKKQAIPEINLDAIEKLGVFGNTGGLCVILDKPSPAQYKQNKPLLGIEKDLIETVLISAGFDLANTCFVFAVPYVYKAELTQSMIEYNHYRLMKHLNDIDPTKILIMGSSAFSVLYNTKKIENIFNWRGKGMYTTVNGKSVYTVSTVPGYYVIANDQEFRELSNDILKLSEKDKPMQLPKAKLFIPENIIEFKRYLRQFKQHGLVSCDLETQGFDPITGKILAIGFGVSEDNADNQLSGETFIIPKELIYHKEVIAELKRWLFSDKTTFILHNAKFDLKFLRYYFNCYIDDINIHDTILLNYVLDERPIGGESGRGISAHGLKTLSRVHYDADDYHFDFDEFSSLPESERNYQDLYEYLSLDLIYTDALFYDLIAEITDEYTDIPFFYSELLIPGTKAIVEMELRGTLLDISYLKMLEGQLKELLSNTLSSMRSQVLHYSGDQKFGEKFNPNSPVQVARMLYDVLQVPRLNANHTDEKTLAKIRQRLEPCLAIDFMDLLLKYREYTKTMGTYVVKWQNEVDKNNRFHANFKINGTITGRLSSDMQQTPRPTPEFNLRKAFIASKGYLFLNADYSQLEMRVAGMLSRDKALTEIYIQGKDLHKEFASNVYKVPVSEVTKDQRQSAKPWGFGILYGRGAQAIIDDPVIINFKFSLADGKRMIDSFLNQFPELKEWIAAIKKQVHTEKYVGTPFGRKRRFPFIHNGNVEDIYRQAINAPIQSYASDFGLWALIKLSKELRQYDSYIVMPVHDSLAIEVNEKYVDKVKELVETVMTNPPIKTNVPLKVDITYSKSWE